MRDTAFERGGNAIIYATSRVSDQPRDVCEEINDKDDYGSGWVVMLGVEPPATSTPAIEDAAPAPVSAAP